MTPKTEARRGQTYAEVSTYGVKRPRQLGAKLWNAYNGKVLWATPLGYPPLNTLSDADVIKLAKRHVQASKSMIRVCERFLKQVQK
jgi:hypothetical protein